MSQQVGNPLGVTHIRLASGNRFDMLRIDHQQFKVAFEQVEDRFPIHPRCLESDMRTSLFVQPIRELQQLLGGGQICPKFFVGLLIGPLGQQAHLDRLLMDVQSGTVGVENLHRNAPLLFIKGCSGLGGEKQRFSSTCC